MKDCDDEGGEMVGEKKIRRKIIGVFIDFENRASGR